jgi:hypothetical protein
MHSGHTSITKIPTRLNWHKWKNVLNIIIERIWLRVGLNETPVVKYIKSPNKRAPRSITILSGKQLQNRGSARSGYQLQQDYIIQLDGVTDRDSVQQ